MTTPPFPAQVEIGQLQTGVALSGSELFECVQGGVSVQVTMAQVASAAITPLVTSILPAGGTASYLLSGTGTTSLASWTPLGNFVVAGWMVDIAGSTTITISLASAQGPGVLAVLGSAVATPVVVGGTANEVLRINAGGTGVAFGAIDLSAANVVQNVLPVVNGGLGFTTAAASSLVGWLNNTTVTSYVVGQLPGIATAANAAAGNIGEYLSTSLPVASAKALTNGVATSVISLSLTPGDWDVSCTIGFTGATSTLVWYAAGSVSNSSSTLNTTLGESISIPGFANAMFTSTAVVNTPTFGFPVVRRSLSATTTQWLTAQVAFTTSTASVYGAITARRAR